ncbi:MAG: FAD-dependent oxidoreductase [Saprospiraceae bacterium]|nr:FAD-dependent oxidoreductase [Saprospiraceae bacterium]
MQKIAHNKTIIFFVSLILGIFQKSAAQLIQTEVLVVGGTLSGTTAGISAARQGSKTVIIEETSWLGGTLSAAGLGRLPADQPFCTGILAEFRDSLVRRYGGKLGLASENPQFWQFLPSEANEIFQNIASKENSLHIYNKVKLLALKKVLPNRERVPNTEGGWQATLSDEKGNTFRVNTRILIDASEGGDALKMAGGGYSVGMDNPQKTGEEDGMTSKTGWLQAINFGVVLQDTEGVTSKFSLPSGYFPQEYQCVCADLCDKKEVKTPSCRVLFKKCRSEAINMCFHCP